MQQGLFQTSKRIIGYNLVHKLFKTGSVSMSTKGEYSENQSSPSKPETMGEICKTSGLIFKSKLNLHGTT